MILRFDDCELDLARVVLRRAGGEVRIEPQVFDLLACLIEHRGQVVRKEELLDQVWGDRFVSESALTTRIKSVRQAVGDDGTRQAVIRTVHGKGYEFVAEVHVVDEPRPDRPPRRSGSTSASAALPAALQPLIGRDDLLTAARRRPGRAPPGHPGRPRRGRQDLGRLRTRPTRRGSLFRRGLRRRARDGRRRRRYVRGVRHGARREHPPTAVDRGCDRRHAAPPACAARARQL